MSSALWLLSEANPCDRAPVTPGHDDESFGHLPSAPAGQHFPETSWSLVRRCRDGDADEKKKALDQLVILYWKPIYRFFQRVLKVHGAELEDVTQEFFACFVEKDFVQGIREEKSFRAFLKLACERFLLKRRKSRCRREDREQKWGHAVATVHEEAELPIDRAIDDEFRRYYLERALEATRRVLVNQGRELHYKVLTEQVSELDGPAPTREQIAKKLGVTVSKVRNCLHEARGVFRDKLREVMKEHGLDADEELRELGLVENMSRAPGSAPRTQD